MRWRANKPAAVASVYFETGTGQEIVPLGRQSTYCALPATAIVNTVTIELSNTKNQRIEVSATLEMDYILLSAKTTP